MGISPSISLINYFSLNSSVCSKILCKELDHTFLLCNIYGPYTDRESFGTISWIFMHFSQRMLLLVGT
jgi:hypothetical protein